MFYQVRCTPKDRDSLRFLWWPNGDLNAEPAHFRMNVHLFGSKSSPSCAAFALLEIAKRFGKYYPCNACEVIKTGFYVDDCLVAVRNEMEAIQLVRDLEGLLARGGFNLTKWISNSPAVMENIKPERRAKGLAQIELGDASEERVLGMRWNVLEDNFQFNVKIPERPPTRRGLLAVTNAVFDPLGLVCPVILKARLIFRSACQRKIGWDEPVPAAEAVKWDKWKNSLCALNDLKLPRCFKGSATAKDMQLHAFADASTVARGAVCYLRYIDCNQQVCCSLIMAKSLLAGSGNHTVPRLELEAALDVVKLVKVVRSELELGACPCIYWTDSTIVLQSQRCRYGNYEHKELFHNFSWKSLLGKVHCVQCAFWGEYVDFPDRFL